jgi:hypothetical protein
LPISNGFPTHHNGDALNGFETTPASGRCGRQSGVVPPSYLPPNVFCPCKPSSTSLIRSIHIYLIILTGADGSGKIPWRRDYFQSQIKERASIWKPNGLLKNAHLLRFPYPSSLWRTSKCASLLRISGALHLGIFEQPAEMIFSASS